MYSQQPRGARSCSGLIISGKWCWEEEKEEEERERKEKEEESRRREETAEDREAGQIAPQNRALELWKSGSSWTHSRNVGR